MDKFFFYELYTVLTWNSGILDYIKGKPENKFPFPQNRRKYGH